MFENRALIKALLWNKANNWQRRLPSSCKSYFATLARSFFWILAQNSSKNLHFDSTHSPLLDTFSLLSIWSKCNIVQIALCYEIANVYTFLRCALQFLCKFCRITFQFFGLKNNGCSFLKSYPLAFLNFNKKQERNGRITVCFILLQGTDLCHRIYIFLNQTFLRACLINYFLKPAPCNDSFVQEGLLKLYPPAQAGALRRSPLFETGWEVSSVSLGKSTRYKYMFN